MNLPLFTSKSSAPEIFIKLGEKCPTKCSGCFYGTVGSNEYEKDAVIISIYEGIKYTQHHFKFFLYGVDTISNKYIYEYLDIIYENNREAVLQIDDAQVFNKEYIKHLLSISRSYKNIEFLLSKNVTSQIDIDTYLLVIKLLTKLHITNIRYDITLDYKKFSEYLKSQSDMRICENEKFFNHQFTYMNTYGSITDLVVKNPKKGKLEGCKFTQCIFSDFYDVGENEIHVKDMIEIDIQGNFRIHHPICFLSDIKISHISSSRDSILQDFKKARKFFSNNYKGDMEKSCYTCIQRGYSY